MTTTEYSARSSARRAAKAAGLDPDKVEKTAGGKFVLPAKADPPISLGTLPARADDLDLTIPKFLRVENRKPLTPAQEKRLAEVQAQAGSGGERVDHRKPKSTSWEDWDRHLAVAETEKRAKSLERIAAIEAKQGEKPKPEPRGPGYKGHLAGSRKGRVHERYDTDGVDAAIKLAADLGLKDGTAWSWIKSWGKTGGKSPTPTAKAASTRKGK